ncbi:hypothetical protein cce_4871 [Crocosphaera subtropica ATCC 51142]|uniref:Uncharacterized protein n=1 Tax=Crocosphaera subtropica (strain ATCC 51142 / BH68) TaxID=43989 RepID=B1X257_CROS5|nr:hypothetical protein [Crocosphaera subtropica]ACB54218.1 hypothetical protein cce_4871 [Crocosphaera subtropica ATCC 51142]
MDDRLILEINEDNANVNITESYAAAYINVNRHTIRLNLSTADFEVGAIVRQAGLNSTIIGSSKIDFFLADSGALLVGNGGDDNLQVAGNGAENCIILGGTGNDTIKALSTAKTTVPSCVLSGGEGSDTFFAVGMKILVTDFEKGDRISIGDPNVKQFISDQGLVIKTEKTEALILDRFEPIPFVEGNYLGF